MAKVTAPLFGFGASGALGKSVVFFPWKGIKAARQYIVPSNPRSDGQVAQRGKFARAVDIWHGVDALDMNAEDVEAWNRYASTLGPMSGFNAFVKVWLANYVNAFVPSGPVCQVDFADSDASAFDCEIAYDVTGTEPIIMHWGNSKTFQGHQAPQALASGVATFTNVNMVYPPGTNVFIWFEYVDTGVSVMRSGLYSIGLT